MIDRWEWMIPDRVVMVIFLTILGQLGMGRANGDWDAGIPPVEVECVIRTIGIGAGDYSGIHLHDSSQGRYLPVGIAPYRRSEPLHYRGPARIVFARLDSLDLQEDNEKEIAAVIEVDPEWSHRELLLFFLPIQEEEDSGVRFRVSVLDDGLDAFPRGSLIIFNGTQIRLHGLVGGSYQGLMEPGGNGPFPLSPDLAIAFAVDTTSGTKIVFENQFSYSAEQRVILILRPPRRKGSLRIQVYGIAD